MRDCCKATKKNKNCRRRSDKKIFSLPRRFTKKRCMKGVKGFTMRSSCAPYKDCMRGGSKKNRKRKRLRQGDHSDQVCEETPSPSTPAHYHHDHHGSDITYHDVVLPCGMPRCRVANIASLVNAHLLHRISLL